MHKRTLANLHFWGLTLADLESRHPSKNPSQNPSQNPSLHDVSPLDPSSQDVHQKQKDGSLYEQSLSESSLYDLTPGLEFKKPSQIDPTPHGPIQHDGSRDDSSRLDQYPPTSRLHGRDDSSRLDQYPLGSRLQDPWLHDPTWQGICWRDPSRRLYDRTPEEAGTQDPSPLDRSPRDQSPRDPRPCNPFSRKPFTHDPSEPDYFSLDRYPLRKSDPKGIVLRNPSPDAVANLRKAVAVAYRIRAASLKTSTATKGAPGDVGPPKHLPRAAALKDGGASTTKAAKRDPFDVGPPKPLPRTAAFEYGGASTTKAAGRDGVASITKGAKPDPYVVDWIKPYLFEPLRDVPAYRYHMTGPSTSKTTKQSSLAQKSSADEVRTAGPSNPKATKGASGAERVAADRPCIAGPSKSKAVEGTSSTKRPVADSPCVAGPSEPQASREKSHSEKPGVDDNCKAGPITRTPTRGRSRTRKPGFRGPNPRPRRAGRFYHIPEERRIGGYYPSTGYREPSPPLPPKAQWLIDYEANYADVVAQIAARRAREAEERERRRRVIFSLLYFEHELTSPRPSRTRPPRLLHPRCATRLTSWWTLSRTLR
jgi:hypothetical protein